MIYVPKLQIIMQQFDVAFFGHMGVSQNSGTPKSSNFNHLY